MYILQQHRMDGLSLRSHGVLADYMVEFHAGQMILLVETASVHVGYEKN